jgi:hypothetical protein
MIAAQSSGPGWNGQPCPPLLTAFDLPPHTRSAFDPPLRLKKEFYQTNPSSNFLIPCQSMSFKKCASFPEKKRTHLLVLSSHFCPSWPSIINEQTISDCCIMLSILRQSESSPITINQPFTRKNLSSHKSAKTPKSLGKSAKNVLKEIPKNRKNVQHLRLFKPTHPAQRPESVASAFHTPQPALPKPLCPPQCCHETGGQRQVLNPAMAYGRPAVPPLPAQAAQAFIQRNPG